jgi:uncharacterized membrane protein YgdD (TMEM256/DUF423 family)
MNVAALGALSAFVAVAAGAFRAVTPLGGVCRLAGWLAPAWGIWRGGAAGS